MSATTNTSPPTECADCGAPVNPNNYAQLRPGGRWVPVEPCPKCHALRQREEAQERKRRSLDHYRQTIPANYRATEDGGHTDLRHPSWSEFKGGVQLSFLRQWRHETHPWAGIVGPGGNLKSRVIGLHARELAIAGSTLLWVNGANLGWATSTRHDDAQKTRANNYLHTYRTHPGTLLLDDLWKGTLTPSYFAALYALLEHRNAHRLPILWTANTDPADMKHKALTDDLRDPIVGRLLENTHLLDLYPA